jgi:hypothetical protein
VSLLVRFQGPPGLTICENNPGKFDSLFSIHPPFLGPSLSLFHSLFVAANPGPLSSLVAQHHVLPGELTVTLKLGSRFLVR